MLSRIKSSFDELSKPKTLAFCGIMGALAVVLSYVATINVGPYVRIGFSTLPALFVAVLFGPVTGGVFGGMIDIVKYLLNPTGPFFFGFTLNAILTGVIHGLFLYKKPIQVPRILLSHLVVKIFVNILLGTLWLNLLYGKAFFALLPNRIVSNAIMLPIDTAITYFALKLASKAARGAFQFAAGAKN